MFAIVTGLITGVIAWRIFEFLKVPEFSSISWGILVIAAPILWILGVRLGYLLGKWFAFFSQFGKFAAIGFTNAAVDFGVLNLLIFGTGVTDGGWYVAIKATSFIAAVIPSYFWNKFWAFYSKGSSAAGFEFAKFISVAVAAIFVNTGISSLVVNFVDPMLGMNAEQWANMAAVVGSGFALIFSFLGFKLAVFKK